MLVMKKKKQLREYRGKRYLNIYTFPFLYFTISKLLVYCFYHSFVAMLCCCGVVVRGHWYGSDWRFFVVGGDLAPSDVFVHFAGSTRGGREVPVWME
jgi:hypothetical protein